MMTMELLAVLDNCDSCQTFSINPPDPLLPSLLVETVPYFIVHVRCFRFLPQLHSFSIRGDGPGHLVSVGQTIWDQAGYAYLDAFGLSDAASYVSSTGVRTGGASAR